MKTRIIFVRHGEAEGNVQRNFHGHFDSRLTENGVLQVRATAEYLRDVPIDVLYSSDLTRTMETARAISQVKNLKINVTSKLREINGGQWEDVPWAELPIRFAESYGLWLNKPHLLVMPEGESMVDFQKRLITTVDKIIKKHSGKSICIVTHGTGIRVLLCYYRGLPLSELSQINWCDNAAVSVVEKENDIFTVINDGENRHLGELSTLAKQTWWLISDKKGDFKGMNREQVLEILKDAGVLLEGHFILTSGKHSAKYLQCAKIFQNTRHSELLCAELAEKYKGGGIDLVIGPAVGAILIAYEVSRQLDVKNIFAERENGKMTLRRGFEIKPGQKVLVVEDVVTTGGSVKEVIELVKSHGGIVAGVGAIVDRTGGEIDFGAPFQSVVSIKVEAHEPANCPLCQAGEEAVKPGSRGLK